MTDRHEDLGLPSLPPLCEVRANPGESARGTGQLAPAIKLEDDFDERLVAQNGFSP